MNANPAIKDFFRTLAQFAPNSFRLLYKVFKHSRRHSDDLGIFLDGVSFFNDGLATIHNSDFLKSPEFQSAYAAGHATGSWRGAVPLWRLHVALWAVSTCERIEGDFVECGVYRGGMARAIVEYLKFEKLDRRYFLFDTFRGLVNEQLSQAERDGAGRAEDYEESLDAVHATFREFPNVVLVPGAIPDSLSTVPIEKVAFLHIDLNCAAPEIAAAEYFWDKLSPGAMVLLDDYGYRGYLPQKEAMDAFAKSKGISILSLPTGQGLWIKPN